MVLFIIILVTYVILAAVFFYMASDITGCHRTCDVVCPIQIVSGSTAPGASK